MNKRIEIAELFDGLIKYLRAVADKDTGQSGELVTALTPIYEGYRKLALEASLSSIDLPESNAPFFLQGLMPVAHEAFLRQSPDLSKERLDDLRELCSRQSYEDKFEAKFLEQEATEWLSRLKELDRVGYLPSELEIGLAPSLDYAVGEEDFNKGQMELPLCIINKGYLPAQEVSLVFTIEGDARFVDTKGQSKKEKLSKSIAPHTTFLEPLSLKHSWKSQSQLKVEIYYEGWSEPGKTATYELMLPTLSDQPSEITNPYIPDSPLSLNDPLLKGPHKRVFDQVREQLAQNPRLLVIHGLRRTGKTSILLALKSQLEKDGYLTVDIDFYLWWSMLYSKGQKASGGELLYRFAEKAASIAEKNDRYLSEQSGNKGNKYLTSDEFGEIIDDLSKEQKIVFLLDDFDLVLDTPEFQKVSEDSEDNLDILWYIGSLSRSKKCTFILTQESFAYQKYVQRKSMPVDFAKGLTLLDQKQVVELARQSSLTYTYMAAELIWKFSGGWAGLLQLLLYRLVEYMQEQSHRLVTADDVKAAIKTVIESPVDRGFLLYFMGSFTPEEIATLQKVDKKELISKETSHIVGLRKNKGKFQLENVEFDQFALERLADEKVIESVKQAGEQIWRLRVGLLAYESVLDLYSADTMSPDKQGMGDQLTSLNIYTAPSLNLEDLEERVEDGFYNLQLPLCLANSAMTPIEQIELFLEVEGAAFNRTETNKKNEQILLENFSAEPDLRSVVSGIPGGQCLTLSVALQYRGGAGSQLRCWARYVFGVGLRTVRETPIQTFKLFVQTRSNKILEKSPYRPASPLYVSNPHLMKGHNRRLVNTLIDSLTCPPEFDDTTGKRSNRRPFQARLEILRGL